MDFCSVNATNHLILPAGYNRVKRYVKRAASAHSARTQAEIHAIALMFKSNLLYIPKLYEVYDNHYETECIYHTIKDFVQHNEFHQTPALFVELFHFKEHMMKEGYFMRGVKLCRISPVQWAIFDFSRFGLISKRMVKFPKTKCLYTLDQAESDYGLKIGRGIESKIDEYDGLYD